MRLGGDTGMLGTLTKIEVYPIAVRSCLKSFKDGVILEVKGASTKLMIEPE